MKLNRFNIILKKNRLPLIILLELILFIPIYFSFKPQTANRNQEDYWKTAGFNFEYLEQYVNDDLCYKEKNLFLACVNAANGIVQRYKMILDLEGKIVTADAKQILERSSQKAEIDLWEKARNTYEQKIVNFKKVLHEIKTQVVPANELALAAGLGYNSFLAIVEDPHSYIMPVSLYEDLYYNSVIKQKTSGLITRKIGPRLIVRKTHKDSPAQISGILPGDEIISINGRPIEHILPLELSDLIKLKDTPRLQIKALRSGTTLNFEILPGSFNFTSVDHQYYEKNKLGYIIIHRFAKSTCDLVNDSLDGMSSKSLRGLILDLRDNPGGQVDEAACVINLFVDKNTKLFETHFIDETKPVESYIAKNNKIYSGPLVVLINSGSASASEIVAGSLQDLNRARIVGERSFGKGSFQDGYTWEQNPNFMYFKTQGIYFFPTGWTAQLIGVNPDLTISPYDDLSIREESAYYNPIQIKNNFSISKGWVTDPVCLTESLLENVVDSDDIQIQNASTFLRCSEL